MVAVTRAIGVAMIVVGVVAYLVTSAESITALAPALVGLVLLALGLAAGREDRRRTMIHAALVVALLGLLATAMPLAELPALLGDGDVERPAAVVASAALAVLCLIYLVLGVRSFVAARRHERSNG